MSDKERYGERDLTYSAWHRAESTKRYLSDFEAWRLGMIDIDDCEYCRWCYEPLALIETAQDVGQVNKTSVVTRNLATMADIPAYLVFYTTTTTADIDRFRVTSLTGQEPIEYVMTPTEYAQLLSSLHDQHECPNRSQ